MKELNKKLAFKVRDNCHNYGDWTTIFKAFAFKYPELSRKLCRDFLEVQNEKPASLIKTFKQ